MPRPKDEQKVEEIFKATLTLVMKEGFSGLRMNDVAKQAKIATGTLYIYFKDKHQLINALYLYLKKQSAKNFIHEEDTKLPFKAAFDKIWHSFLKNNLDNPQEAAFLEQYYRSPFLDTEVKDEAYQLLKPIYDLLERGKKEMLIKDIDTEILLAQISGAISEFIKLDQAGLVMITEEVKQIMLQLAWDSIKK